jgi:hypothetical protein
MDLENVSGGADHENPAITYPGGIFPGPSVRSVCGDHRIGGGTAAIG